MKEISITLPPIFKLNIKYGKNLVQQIAIPSSKKRYIVEKSKNGNFILHTPDNKETILILSKPNKKDMDKFDKVLRLRKDGNIQNVDDLKWIKHPRLTETNTSEKKNIIKNSSLVLDSWTNAFSYKVESKNTKGLRPPQIGALHSIQAHWTISNDPATVVMPTGTGKTETMLSITVAEKCNKVLVVVPSDALRTQIANKFLSLGILKELGVLKNEALYPVVAILRQRLKDKTEVETIFGQSNVIITTMQTVAACDEEIQKFIASQCSYLFIDEAHHIAAPTWKKFRNHFTNKKIIQFTATPFRNDGKPVDGKIIYNYPLEKAQREGYFKNINFIPVVEFDFEKSDEAIAKRAIKQLREDLANHYDHILMARVKNIKRTFEVFNIYKQYTEFNPVIIHSGMADKEKKKILSKIKNRESRIIICVDMLGEGFDLPELKIAALHDPHKSLGITLQFTGRFTRTKANIGDASVVANIADAEVNENLKNLYAEDANWNILLRNSSSETIQKQIEIAEFIEGFSNEFLAEIPVRNIFPKMSTQVFETNTNTWTPENFHIYFDKSTELYHALHKSMNVLVIIEKNVSPVAWGTVKEINNVTWEMYIIYWNKEKNLLFINSTAPGQHLKLAEAVIHNPQPINGDRVYNSFAGINRLILQNVGLNDAFDGPLSYRMYTGTDVKEGLTDAHKKNTFKSNIFGIGFEDGEKTSIGCSYKGKIWSKKVTNVIEWCKWCDKIGDKLLNKKINPDEILQGVLESKRIESRPKKIPLTIEWPASFSQDSETNISLIFDEMNIPLYAVSIDLVEHNEEGPIKFKIYSDFIEAHYEFDFEESKPKYTALDNDIVVVKGRHRKKLSEWFYEEGPIIRFSDGSYMENRLLVEVNKDFNFIYDKNKIETLEWDRVDITKESQGDEKRPDSIQYHIISLLKQKNYDIIFDDDSSGEAADIITIRVENEQIFIEFYHCKYSKKSVAGARVDDLYEVCGQAQKSIQWKENPKKLIEHMIYRERSKYSSKNVSRFEIGDNKKLVSIKRMLNYYKCHLHIFIVQPGVSKAKITDDQLQLLAATENYLMETYKIKFTPIFSK